MQLSGDQQLLKSLNRMAIVRHLSAHPGHSRAAVAAALQLTKSTVSLLVKELADEGWLSECDAVVTGELGRRPTPLHLDQRRLVLLGAELGVQHVRVVATSLTGTVLANACQALPSPCEPEAGIALLARLLIESHARLDARLQRVMGIGLGVPGGMDEASGYLHYAPNLGWRNVPAGALLVQCLAKSALRGVPLFLQNEADAAALGELEFARAQPAAPLIYLSLGHGVGAGIIALDQLLAGAHGFAGEVGHTILELEGPLCSCGRRGCAEAVIGLRAMLDTQHTATSAPASLQEVQKRLSLGDERTVKAVRRAGKYLGMLLWNLYASYDPGSIVLGGPAVEIGAIFLEPALNVLDQYLNHSGLARPQVSITSFGAEAVAVGGAALARYRLTRPPLNASLLAAAA